MLCCNVSSLDVADHQQWLVYQMSIKRRAQFYMTNLVAPVLAIAIAGLLCFFVPYDGGERITLMITTVCTFLPQANQSMQWTNKCSLILAVYISAVHLSYRLSTSLVVQ